MNCANKLAFVWQAAVPAVWLGPTCVVRDDVAGVSRPGGLFFHADRDARDHAIRLGASRRRAVRVPPPDSAKCDSEQTGTQQHKAGRCYRAEPTGPEVTTAQDT